MASVTDGDLQDEKVFLRAPLILNSATFIKDQSGDLGIPNFYFPLLQLQTDAGVCGHLWTVPPFFCS